MGEGGAWPTAREGMPPHLTAAIMIQETDSMGLDSVALEID
jgi:hypothetical protein